MVSACMIHLCDCELSCFLHSHVAPSDRMMQGCFSLQVYEAQICSVLHHLVHDVDVPLPERRTKGYDKESVTDHIMKIQASSTCTDDAHLQPK